VVIGLPAGADRQVVAPFPENAPGTPVIQARNGESPELLLDGPDDAPVVALGGLGQIRECR